MTKARQRIRICHMRTRWEGASTAPSACSVPPMPMPGRGVKLDTRKRSPPNPPASRSWARRASVIIWDSASMGAIVGRGGAAERDCGQGMRCRHASCSMPDVARRLASSRNLPRKMRRCSSSPIPLIDTSAAFRCRTVVIDAVKGTWCVLSCNVFTRTYGPLAAALSFGVSGVFPVGESARSAVGAAGAEASGQSAILASGMSVQSSKGGQSETAV